MAFSPETKKLLEKAKQMNKVGKPLQEIREQTGWFIGLDGNWKYAIDDSSAEILIGKDRIGNLAKGRTSETAIAYPLSGILSHPEFEQYYPGLSKNIEVTFYGKQDKNTRGSVEGFVREESNGKIGIRLHWDEGGTTSLNALQNTLLHEIQHSIQGQDREHNKLHFGNKTQWSTNFGAGSKRSGFSGDDSRGLGFSPGGESSVRILETLKRAKSTGRGFVLNDTDGRKVDPKKLTGRQLELLGFASCKML